MLNLRKTFLGLGVGLLASSAVAQFTPGNILVLRIGDGTAALSNASTAQFLDEYTTAGVLVQTVSLPVAVSGSNRPVTASGSATSEGQFTSAFNGKYFVVVGYDTVPGLASVAASAVGTVNRVVARVDMNGAVDSSTRINDAFSANNIRSGYTVDGTSFYASGANTGVVSVPLGNSGASTLISTTFTNTRVLGGFNGQLYLSSGASSLRLGAVGTVFPTTNVSTVGLPGFPTSGFGGFYAFSFGSNSQIFMTNDVAIASGGGVLQYDFNGSTWNLTSTITNGLTVGTRGVAIDNTTSTLYAVDTNGNVRALDLSNVAAGFGSPLITQATNTANRSIQVVPDFRPKVTGLVASSANELIISFSEPVNAAALNASNYTLSGPGQGSSGANPLTVVSAGPNSYSLTFSGAMVNGSDVTVTVGGPVQDLFGYNLSAMANSASVVAVPVTMSGFSAE
jgi:hypothetical protein